MKVKCFEIKDKNLLTVEDYIDILLTCPKGYVLYPVGEKCNLAINNYEKSVHLDTDSWLSEYKDSFLDYIQCDEETEIDIDDVELEPYALKVYCLVNHEDICINGNKENVLIGTYLSKELAEKKVCELMLDDYEIIETKINE